MGVLTLATAEADFEDAWKINQGREAKASSLLADFKVRKRFMLIPLGITEPHCLPGNVWGYPSVSRGELMALC